MKPTSHPPGGQGEGVHSGLVFSGLSQAKVLVLCSLERHLTLTVSPYSQKDTFVQEKR